MNKPKRTKRVIPIIKYKWFVFVRFVKRNFINTIIICASASLGCFSFYQFLWHESLINVPDLLSNLLTVNGVFSAILITYLFTRLVWVNERRRELFNECVKHSQKITEFRRILDKLTRYYNVWNNQDQNTKSLIDFGKFEKLDFYDFKLSLISDYKSADEKLINELFHDANFIEGKTTTYLAMVSMVKNRKSDYHWQEELYKDFEKKGIYRFETIKKWLECGIADTISYWMNHDPDWINYHAIREYKDDIIRCASRINEKYAKYEVNNKLIEELAEDMQHHYITELYRNQKQLRKGIEGMNMLILILVTISLAFGVLAPLLLILIQRGSWFLVAANLIVAINVSLISYFVFKFPFLIKRELEWD